MEEKEQWAETQTRKTQSWQSQPDFDRELGHIDVSGLSYLLQKYEKQLDNYYYTHDLSKKLYFQEYRGIQQRYKMINEELEKRIMDTWASPTYYGQIQHTFDSTTGIVRDADGIATHTVDFNEDEDGFVIRDLEGTVIENKTTDIKCDNIELSRKDVYKSWDYWSNQNTAENALDISKNMK